MGDDRKRGLIVLVVVGLATLAFFGWEWIARPDRVVESSNSAPAAYPDDGPPNDVDTDPASGSGGKATDDSASASAGENKPSEQTATIETDEFIATFSNLSGGLKRFELKSERFERDGKHQQLVSTYKPKYYPLQASVAGLGLTDDTVWKIAQPNPRAIELRAEANDFEVTRKIEAGKGPYQLWITTSIANRGDASETIRLREGTWHWVTRDEESGGFFAVKAAAISHGVCRYGDETVRKDREDLLEPHGYGGKVRFAGIENGYFAWVLAADGGTAARCALESSDRPDSDNAVGSLLHAELVYAREDVAPGKATTHRTLAYVGPKLSEPLAAAGHGLPEVVDLGFFSTIAGKLAELLSFIHGYVGNWGLAIILLTVLVKLVLYPLTEKSFQSMARMRLLKPEMDRINELYADDPQKKGAAMMELYRKHKINPLGGCLPQLLQLPIWFSLYTSLSTNVELYNAPFILWWQDLSSPDAYFVLPLTLGALMFVQQKITPSTMDPTQAKMMLYLMPSMITAFMLFLPAGLCLYMVTNSTLGIAQQQFIQRRLEKQDKATKAQQAAAPEDGGPAPDEPKTEQQNTSATPASRRSSRPRARAAHRRQRRGRA